MSTPITKRKKSLTILEKAELYRKKNPESWQDRKDEIQEEKDESLGKYKNDSFLNNYYAKKEKKRKEEETEKELAPALKLQLVYLSQHRKSGRKFRQSGRKFFRMFAQPKKIIRKEKSFTGCCCRKHNDVPELRITIIEGERLNNALAKDIQILRKCQVICHLFLKEKEKPQSVKTNFESSNIDGTTEWYFRVSIRGYTVEELEKSFVVLEVIGKNNFDTYTLGHILLSGDQAHINWKGQSGVKPPSEHEKTLWHEALKKPDESVDAELKINRFAEKDFGASLLSIINKESQSGNLIGLKLETSL